MSLKDALQESDKILEKGITASDVSETANGNTLRPPLDLVPFITDVANRQTPIVNMLLPRAKQGIGKAHVFNKMDTYVASGENLRDAFYGSGDLPREATTQYSQVAVPFKAAGYSGSVDGLAEAQGGDFLALYSNEVESKMRLLEAAMEWNFYYGSTSITSPNTSEVQFAGLDELITQEVDAGGVRLTGTTGKEIINRAANIISMNGGYVTHLLVDLATEANVLDTYELSSAGATTIYKMDGGSEQIWGGQVRKIRTQAGELDVVGDFFLNPGNSYTLANGSQSTPSGATTATAYMVNMDYINFVTLRNMELLDLGRRSDKREFFIRIYPVLENLATQYCVKITNISTSLVTT